MGWFCEFDPVSILQDQNDLNFVQYFIPVLWALELRKSLNSKPTLGMPSGINLQKLIIKEINKRQLVPLLCNSIPEEQVVSENVD